MLERFVTKSMYPISPLNPITSSYSVYSVQFRLKIFILKEEICFSADSRILMETRYAVPNSDLSEVKNGVVSPLRYAPDRRKHFIYLNVSGVPNSGE